MKRWGVVLIVLLGFGVWKTPVERSLWAEQKAAGFHAAQWNLGMRDQVGQMGFVAALGGFRALVADVLWVRAGAAFERREWGRLKLLLDSVTQLQPRSVIFWRMAHDHMAYDAALDARHDPLEHNDFVKRKAEREYLRIGEQFLLNGLKFNPESALLYECLGNLYSRRMGDPARASEAYAFSAQKPGAMGYVGRFAIYESAKVPGREKEAYAQLCELYRKGQRFETVIRLLRKLEAKLEIPAAQSIFQTANADPAQGTLAP